MDRLLSYLICFCGFFPSSLAVLGQCGYTAAINTNKDYCVGSSLIARSAHALQSIVWYKSGQPVKSATGDQSLAAQPLVIPLFPDTVNETAGFSDIGTDGAGNIYVADYGNQRVIKWTPGSGSKEIIAGPMPNLDFASIFVDQPGNVYVLSSDSGSVALGTTLVEKYPAGSGDSTTAVAKPIGHVYTYGPARNLFMYCPCDFYIGSLYGIITKWAPGVDSGILVATPGGGATYCTASAGLGRVRVDSAGNIFFIVGSGVQRLAPGATGAVYVTEADCAGSPGKSITDFWLDGKDTIYEDGYDATNRTLFVEKWAPGASSGETIASFPYTYPNIARLSFTMDIRGNFYFAPDISVDLLKLARTTSIDSAYMPTDTGTYYAVVTDIQGYTTTTDSIVINTPSAGPPAIRISATADSTPVCTPITFTVNVTNAGLYPAYQWDVSGVRVGGDSTTYSNNLFANGDQVYCILTAQAGCNGPVTDTSNLIMLDIDPHGSAAVTIATPKTSICQGDTVEFKATGTNGSSQPVFEWLLNGANTGDDSAAYIRNNFSTGDVVTCLITSDDVCGLAKSNSIMLAVSIPPVIAPGEIFTIPYGKSLVLDPAISGDVSTWLWTPATGLSDPHIADPVADPSATMLYTLTVMAAGGCSDSAAILVNVYTPLSLPNAFTPNGDGHNDWFYVLGGPVNSVVEAFAVFNRWGQMVFQAHNVAPGDHNAGWDGRICIAYPLPREPMSM